MVTWNDNFLNDLYSYLKELNKNKDVAYYGNGLHASSIGYCKRRAVYEYYGLPANEHTLNTLLTFKAGEHMHELMVAYLKQSKRYTLVDSEVDISGGLPEVIKGRYDFRIFDMKRKKIILGDTKTANPNQFKKYTKSLPKPQHEIQLNIYGYACRSLGIPFDEMKIFYIDKGGTNTPQIYRVKEMKDISDIMYAYVEAINRYAIDEELPEVITDEKDRWKCGYCNYWKIVCDGYIEPPKEEDSQDDFITFCNQGV